VQRISQQDLPQRGISHVFTGAEHDTGISSYLVSAPPGAEVPPHRHPYDEVHFMRGGRAAYEVDGATFEAVAGHIVIIKAGEVHGFRVMGTEPVQQVAIHLSPVFIQENLRDGAIVAT
jgi:quercetin dioxygenase-like cupin family protein